MSRTLLLAALLAAPALAAQDASGFDRLDAEVFAAPVPDSVDASPRLFAWMQALQTGRYARADSIAVLARIALEDETGAPYDSLVWPDVPDALALRFLRGDPEALAWIADGGRWWQPVPAWGADGLAAPYTVSDPDWLAEALPATRAALRRDSSRAIALLREVGATDEEVAAARLALARLAAGVDREDHWPGLLEGEDAVEAQAAAFLDAYPASPYAAFARREGTPRFRQRGEFAATLSLGGIGATGALGAETGTSVALVMGAGLRTRWTHASVGVQVAQMPFRRSFVSGREEIVEGEALSLVFLGASGGPRLAAGPVALMPYVSGGLLLQSVGAVDESEETFSTYEPPTRLSWGYGAAAEVGVTALMGEGTRLRVGVHRMHPALHQGFDDLLPGRATAITLGFTGSLPVFGAVQ